MLYERLVKRLRVEGKEAVPEVIGLMDSYFLTKDDWEAIHELGVGTADWERSENKIETQAKATFTRVYNQQSHPLPFMKASQVLAPKRAPAKERPDLEEALEESADEAPDPVEAAADDDEEDVDLSKDKYVKQPKKRKATAAAGAEAKGGAGAGKKRKAAKGADDEEEEDEGEEGGKGKKGTAAKGKGKGRAKK
ncbi:DNA replication factor C complex subunit Rfc1 [Teratosphaeriaceae sp. CCFEE 6253]|nr:DNA replication factor C complex subunit Rfc1 [Teratosphaeriaceae sp. CCFEE 6253]